jgi:hypothetical protein
MQCVRREIPGAAVVEEDSTSLRETGSGVTAIGGSPELRKICVHVDVCRINGRVPHEDLDVANIGPAFDEGRRKAVPQNVRRDAPLERRLGDRSHALVDPLAREWALSSPVEKYVGGSAVRERGRGLEIKFQCCDGWRTEKHEPVFSPLAVPNFGGAGIEV